VNYPKQAKLITRPHNYAVVQLPERSFPGVVVQGDSLNNLIGLLEEARISTAEKDDLILEVLDILKGAQSGYESACADEGISLPYVKN
jgi:hypothetical protein